MESAADLLVEIGTEELPPLALAQLSRSFADGVTQGLRDAEIQFGSVESFATPRRLAVLIGEVATQQPDREAVRRGPALAAAFGADGKPSKAAEGFARSCGVTVAALARERTDKGEWLVFRSLTPGRPTADLIPGIVTCSLAALPIPRRMRWGAGEESFVRPVHSVCLMLGERAIRGSILGVEAAGATFGHRFHHPERIPLASARDYAGHLRAIGFVEPSFEARRGKIASEVEALAKSRGLRAELDLDLLDEVAALVEWPRAIVGGFEAAFLEVPAEVLIETMRKNQKYFPLRDASGRLQPFFVAIGNIESRDPDQVRAGNERVIRPRFSDAKFFWEQDLKHPLGANLERLEEVVFQERLGSIADKSRRVARLAKDLGRAFGEDAGRAERAALLSKCDLLTAMVYEFPALQGIMGRYYAFHSGEDPAVCDAMEQQYLPRFAGDSLPTEACGRLLAVADRLDTLVGVFGIGQRPTGTKDPYGLRRASIAVLRILIETPVSLDLTGAVRSAVEGYPHGVLSVDTEQGVVAYILDRLGPYYQEQEIARDSVDAALASGSVDPSDLDKRIRAVEAFRSMSSAGSLAAANKRIRNILAKGSLESSNTANPSSDLLQEPAERHLWARIQDMRALVGPLMTDKDYIGVLGQLAHLREDVDRFFEEVLVMVDDDGIRANRLALLASLHDLFLNVADISKLQIGEVEGRPE